MPDEGVFGLQQTGGDTRSVLDTPAAIAAAAYITGLNMLVVNLQPLILGAFADSYGFSDRQLGHVSAIFVGFATLCSLTGPLWVRKIDWRNFSRLMIVLAVATLATGAYLDEVSTIFALFAVLGVVKAALGIPAFASLGDGSNPDRNYGVSVGFQGLLAAAVSAPCAAFILPRFGIPGLFLTIAVLVATGLAVSRWLPRHGIMIGPAAASEGTGPRGSFMPAVIALIALASFTAAILGFWYFIERIGAAKGVSAATIGLTLSAISAASILTASLVAWLGGRFPSMAFILVGTILLLLAFAGIQFEGSAAFIGGAILFALGWGLAQPAYYALVRIVDGSGRLFVAAPAAGGIAGVAIGMAAGPLIEQGGYNSMVATCASLAVAAVAAGFVAQAAGAPRTQVKSPRVFGKSTSGSEADVVTLDPLK